MTSDRSGHPTPRCAATSTAATPWWRSTRSWPRCSASRRTNCATIYRTQFAVLHGYDQNDYIYDANGRLVPTQVRQLWRKKGDKLTEEERTATHPAGTVYTYELPFAPRDREADFTAVRRGTRRW